MSLEQAIAANTAAIEKLTEAFAKLAERAASLPGPITAGGVSIAEAHRREDHTITKADFEKYSKENKFAEAKAEAKEAVAKGEAFLNSVKPKVEEQAETEEYDFDTVKTAFLTLYSGTGGRPKCEEILGTLGIAKLSGAKPEQYGELMALIAAA